ncbi:MAG: nitrogenase-stabilizing/protective protein NifW [Nitrospirota bacterium]
MEYDLTKEFNKLVDAEDYLRFFAITYDPRVVHVNRLHILKKFALFKNEIDRANENQLLEERLFSYREAMRKAYETFLTSTAPAERLFKVFQQPPPGLVQITMSPALEPSAVNEP